MLVSHQLLSNRLAEDERLYRFWPRQAEVFDYSSEPKVDSVPSLMGHLVHSRGDAIFVNSFFFRPFSGSLRLSR